MYNMIKKAILLAGGNGTRLHPFTYYTSKHLLPIYDKPMIFYPLTNLILLGVETVYLIINPKHEGQWKQLLNNLNVNISIKLINQENPDGIPDGIKICKDYLRNDDFYLALGDNLLLGSGLINKIKQSVQENNDNALIITYPVSTPEKFGIAEFNDRNELKVAIEKPINTTSNRAIVGLYKFTKEAVKIANGLQKKDRGEYEIVDIINFYIKNSKCSFIDCDSSTDYWLDTGSIEALLSASSFLKELHKTGRKILGDISFN